MAAVAALALTSPAGWAQPAPRGLASEASVRAEVARTLQRLYGTDAALDARVRATYGKPLAPAQAAVAKHHMRRLVRHPRFSDLLTEVLLQADRQRLNPVETAQAVQDALSQLQTRGLRRLPREQQAVLVAHFVAVGRHMDYIDCKRLFTGQLSLYQVSQPEQAYMAGLAAEPFERIATVYADASLAELEQSPAVVVIDAEHARAAHDAARLAGARALWNRLPVEVVQAYLTDPASVSPRDACDVNLIAMASMLDLAEPYRTWRIALFIDRF